jgi:hypothetical protein
MISIRKWLAIPDFAQLRFGRECLKLMTLPVNRNEGDEKTAKEEKAGCTKTEI